MAPQTHNPGYVPNSPLHKVLTVEQQAFFSHLPKTELHCHLLGTVREATFRDLVQKTNAPFTPDEITAFYTRGEKPIGVLRVLRALDEYLLTTPEDLYRITYEYLEDAAKHHVRYSEFYWNPTGTVRVSKIPYHDAQAGIVTAIRDAKQKLGIIGRLLPSIDREAEPAEAVAMVEWMLQNPMPEVIGIGIDYRENDRPPELFWKAYRMAKAAGYKITAHAGEFGMPWHNVETAVKLLECDRIDHGYTIIDNPDLVQECVSRDLIFTVVPTNSYYLRTLSPERWALDHPIRQMVKMGLRVHPNTDDPTLHHVNPQEAWLLMYAYLGFSLAEIKQFMYNGIEGAWIDQHTQSEWKQAWGKEFDELALRYSLNETLS